jgi:hypothetical protein
MADALPLSDKRVRPGNGVPLQAEGAPPSDPSAPGGHLLIENAPSPTAGIAVIVEASEDQVELPKQEGGMLPMVPHRL